MNEMKFNLTWYTKKTDINNVGSIKMQALFSTYRVSTVAKANGI